MSWQDAVVAAVFLGAVAFLARTFFPRRKKTSAPQAFIPLGRLKKKP